MKNDVSTRSLPGQLILGLGVIGIGVLFLLDNLGLWDFHHALHFWPVVFILFGVARLCDTRSPDGYLLGVALVFVGAMMTLNRLDILYFSWHTIWPILLIALGVLVLFKSLGVSRARGARLQVADGNDAVVDVVAILGGFERRITHQAFRGGEVTAVMSGCVLDMREASIEGEAIIDVCAVFGGIEIKVPYDWTVVLHGTPVMGGFEEKTVRPPDASKRLIVRGYAVMGGVEVRN